MTKAWYLEEYEEKTYLHNKMLRIQDYTEALPDHDHCELCWARFSEYPEDHHRGYFEAQSNSWICNDCFQGLATLFGWHVEM